MIVALRQRALANLINSVHDLYIASPNSSNPAVTATQGCMYKPVDQIDALTRAAKVAEIDLQLGVLEGLVVGPLLCEVEKLPRPPPHTLPSRNGRHPMPHQPASAGGPGCSQLHACPAMCRGGRSSLPGTAWVRS